MASIPDQIAALDARMVKLDGSLDELLAKLEGKSAAPPAAPAAPAAPANKEAPRPMIFALMRNGHEVLRGAMSSCQAALDSPEPLNSFPQRWSEFCKWQAMHTGMEEGVPDVAAGLFKVLDDKFEGVATAKGLSGLHTEMLELEGAVSKAIAAGDVDACREAYTKFAVENEAHLKAEEGVMEPKVMAMAKAGENMKALMVEQLLPAALAGDMTFFVSFAMRTLEAYEAETKDGQPKTRVFAHALKAVATAEQWADWRIAIKDALSSDKYVALDAEIGI